MTNSFLNSFFFLWLFLFTSCENNAEKESHYTGTIVVDGITRKYIVNIPPSYFNDDSTQFPLVLGLHGLAGSGSQFERDYHFSEKSNEVGFIAVYPEGVRSDGPLKIRTWNAGSCCDYAMQHQIDDVNFISKLIDKLAVTHRINLHKVYVTGMSNGGMMAYRLACELPDKIAAIAPVSSTMVMDQPCHPGNPVPLLHMHSAQDTKVPFTGGTGLGGYYFPPVDSVLNAWSIEDGCTSYIQTEDRNTYVYKAWATCNNSSSIQCYLTDDGGHAWPGGSKSGSWADTPSTAINANDLMWAFFQRYELP